MAMTGLQQLGGMQQPGMQGYGSGSVQPFQIGSQGMKPLKKRSGIGEFFLGKQERFNQTPTQTPQAMQALMQLLQGGMQGLQDPYAGFDPIAQQAQEQFQSETVPSIAERFTAAGGGQNSSAFQGALGSAGSGLQRQLAAMKSEYGMQNRGGLLNQLQLGLTPQFETQFRPRQKGFLETTNDRMSQLAAQLLPMLLKGGM